MKIIPHLDAIVHLIEVIRFLGNFRMTGLSGYVVHTKLVSQTIAKRAKRQATVQMTSLPSMSA